ncbi:hypothetical protein [Antrihabitans sp. YC2-6]|uniref:hypothetical protein n=1 Tax=Antrihabitans sp. YC2-6 TaxID=2799498 RepID=UPI0018F44083|nr:hypothetical protein [Antrihabitans sp. YC2-6]MBJ8343728.1 hypothetical protein [Antrihabitans sp. YC2-6]
MSLASRLCMAATALAAFSVLAVTPSAQAAPPSANCTQYAFDGEFIARGDGIDFPWTVTFTSTGLVPGGSARVKFDDGGIVDGTIISGEINRHVINFRIKWNNKPDNVWVFSGIVGDDGIVRHGTELLSGAAPASGSYWESLRPLNCVAFAPEPGNSTLDPDAPISPADLPG